MVELASTEAFAESVPNPSAFSLQHWILRVFIKKPINFGIYSAFQHSSFQEDCSQHCFSFLNGNKTIDPNRQLLLFQKCKPHKVIAYCMLSPHRSRSPSHVRYKCRYIAC